MVPRPHLPRYGPQIWLLETFPKEENLKGCHFNQSLKEVLDSLMRDDFRAAFQSGRNTGTGALLCKVITRCKEMK